MAGTWLNLQTARDDLRRFVHDGPSDRLVKEKSTVGTTNGVNKDFMTWDDRLIGPSLRVTVDYVVVPVDQVTQEVDDQGVNLVGMFTLATAPSPTTSVRAQYYYLFFLDAELETALQMAAQELIENDDVTQLPAGLKLTALHFAGHFTYQKQAMRWAQKMSNKFLMIEEPANNDNMMRPNMFRQIAADLWKTGVELRDGYYMRHGRRHAPSFAVFKPVIPRVGPRA